MLFRCVHIFPTILVAMGAAPSRGDGLDLPADQAGDDAPLTVSGVPGSVAASAIVFTLPAPVSRARQGRCR